MYFCGPMARRKGPKFLEGLTVERMAAKGKCVAHHDGQVVFISNVAPGDVVDVRVVKRNKRFLEAVPTQLHQAAPVRVEPFCSHFGLCGGCKWQHIDYPVQLQYKQQEVMDALERIGKIELPPITPILGSDPIRYYRNKLEFTFSNQRWLTEEEVASEAELDRNALGFHIPGRWDKVMPVDHCYLQADPSNAIRDAVHAYATEHELDYFDPYTQEGLLRILMLRTTSTGEVMVLVQFARRDQEAINGVLSHLKEQFPQITALLYVINEKKNDTIYDLEIETFAGQDYITEEMEGLKFRIGPKSFYQTNSPQAYELYKVARDYAGLTGEELVYDLYTGTGTIAQFVAKQARQVVGIESVPEAIEDAKQNARHNGIENTKFFAGDMKDLLTEEFFTEHGRPDVIITDPPRVGMHEAVVNQLLRVRVPRIVYVSCNPSTQARDLNLLDAAYRVTAVQPVDMFPHTHHVENVVQLELRD